MKIITTHPNADFDSFGGIVGLLILNPDSFVFFPGKQEIALKNLISLNIYKINEITLKEIEKENIEKIFVIDVEDLERLGRLYELIIQKRIPVEIYDHHPEQKNYPEWAEVYKKNYGSVSAYITEILIEKGAKISPTEASLILLGIYEDTGNFHFQETTEADFKAAAWLLSKGASINFVHKFLMQELTPEHLEIIEQFYSTKEEIKIKDFYVTFAYANLPYFVEDIAFAVHKFVDLIGKDIFFGFVEQEGKINIIGRSRDERVKVGEILRELNGGGHGGAGSAVLKNIPLSEAKTLLIEALMKKSPSLRKAEDIMNFPVYYVSPKTKILDALKKMNFYHINGMPVILKGEIKGAITRQLIDRAISHGLKEAYVEDIMDPNVIIVEKTKPVEEFKTALLGSGKRFIIVKDGNKIAGIITRVDLYKSLISKEEYNKEIFEAKVVDMKRVMEQYFPKNIIEKLKEIGKIAEEEKMKAFLVGGTVRDMVLGLPLKDIDVVIEGDALKIGEKVSQKMDAIFKPHLKFLTGVLNFKDGTKIDLATARKERYPEPASLPEVEASIIAKDLARRDFTINTLIVSLTPSTFGKLYDRYNGLQDLKNKSIQVLETLSFVEDPTRAFRALRLCEKLKFKLSSITERLIKNAINQGVFENLSGSRLWEEFSYLLELSEPYSAMEKLEKLGLLKVLNPQIKLNQKIENLFQKIKEMLSWANFENISLKYWKILYLSALSVNLKEEELKKLSLRLNLNSKEAEYLFKMKGILRLINFRLKKAEKPSEIYKALKNVDILYLFWAIANLKDNFIVEKIKLYITKYSKIKIEISGKDLLKAGFSESPLIGKALEKVLYEKLDGKLKTREEELKFALDFLKNQKI